MSDRREQRAAEAAWRESQRGVLHDEHDAATDPEGLPPLTKALAALAALLAGVAGFVGWVLPAIADKVFL
jgi:hypothetical protein